ncbi:MAG: hypothetical protein HQL75_18555 [Magnetococcales bacterium]|nr:hypothetical protein [Magnetococcales bacterium]
MNTIVRPNSPIVAYGLAYSFGGKPFPHLRATVALPCFYPYDEPFPKGENPGLLTGSHQLSTILSSHGH